MKLFPRRIERHHLADNLPSVHFSGIRCRCARADRLELRPAQARGQVAKLTPSLLARTFEGQL